jgi:hypothetical protein
MSRRNRHSSLLGEKNLTGSPDGEKNLKRREPVAERNLSSSSGEGRNQQGRWSDLEEIPPERSGMDSVRQSLPGSSQSSPRGEENLQPPTDRIQFPTGDLFSY